MQHLILGYGYCGYYLAKHLLQNNQKVTTLSRHLAKDLKLPKINHIIHDLNHSFHWDEPDTIAYYLIPPSPQGESDLFLKQFLNHSAIKAKKIIYFGTSGVYGNHQGAWVHEDSPCLIDNSRQLRRLDAEQQWLNYCKIKSIDCTLLRVAGIYGPQRIPIDAARAKTPLIEKDKAPQINHIFVKDLAAIAYLLSQEPVTSSIYNVADGNPQPMGTLQQHVAEALKLELAPYESWSEAWEKASLMKREFMKGSKRLNINRLQATLGVSFLFTQMSDAVKQSMPK